MNYNIITLILPFIIPYNLLGENIANLLLSINSILFILINRKHKYCINKNIITLISLFLLPAIISIILIDRNIYAISGFSIYINIMLYYIIFTIIKSKQYLKIENIKYILYSIIAICTLSIIYEGIILEKRLIGNIGYANTYALILFIGVFLNNIIEDKYKFEINITLMLGILLTSSRTTFLILIVYILFNIYITKPSKYYNLSSFSISILLYIILKKIGLSSLFVLPIFIILSIAMKDIFSKTNKIIIYTLCLFSIICFIIIPTNNLDRIKNISFSNGSLQERLISFEDSISAIKDNLMGLGINTYDFNHYEHSSAFYDIKYLHNSILQVSYDIGMIGGILFIFIFIIINYYIYKSKDTDKFNKLLVINSILFHSLIDFDIVFSTVMISVVLILVITLNDEKLIINNNNNKYLSILIYPILIINIYCLTYEGFIVLSERSINLQTQYKLEKYIPIKDYRYYMKLSDSLVIKYKKNNNKSYLIKAKEKLLIAEKLNNKNPHIKWNLAYIYEKLDDIDNSILKWDEVINYMGNYYDSYIAYNKLLEKKYLDTNNIYYKNKINYLSNIYYKNYKSLNKKSKYLKNQLLPKL